MRLAITACCVIAALAIAACGKSNKSSSSTGTTSAPTATSGTGPPGGLPLHLTEFKFQPSRIAGQGGHQLTLDLRNTGTVEHNFSVDAQHIEKDVKPGKDVKVTITVPGSGSVQFYCKYHKSRGMTGSITVGGASAPPTNTSTGSSGKGYGY